MIDESLGLKLETVRQHLIKIGQYVDASSAQLAGALAELSAALMELEIMVKSLYVQQEALRHSEQAFRSIVENSDDGIVLADERGVVMEWNRKQAEITGLRRGEVLGRFIWDVQSQLAVGEYRMPQAREQLKSRILQFLNTGQIPGLGEFHEQTVQRADGTRRTIQTLPVPIATEHGFMIASTIRDVTDQRRMEAALRESEERYRALVEASPDAIVLTDLDGRIMLGNQRMAEIAGYERVDELLSREAFDLLAPQDRERARADVRRVVQETIVRDTEYLLNRRDGRTTPIEASGSIILTANQQPSGLVIVVRDITDRKQADALVQQGNRDLVALNAELQVRNEELDAFAHTVAHDLKNPLHLIIGFAETLRPSFSDLSDEEREDALRHITRNGRKMNNIVDELLLLAEVRKTQVQMSPLDLSRILFDAQQRLTDMIHDRHAAIIAPERWPNVLGYAPWVEEVWVNYLSNALKYGGTSSAAPRVSLGADLLPDGMVRLWVHDNGDGIAPEVQARLFTPFTRLDRVRARGHGLGLSIVRRIVDKMGGQVGVTSEGVPGQGSIFFFTLPLAPQDD